MTNHKIIQSANIVRAKLPKYSPLIIFGLVMEFPKNDDHIFRIGVRFIRPPIKKCLHSLFSLFDSSITIVDMAKNPQTVHHIRYRNGAVSLENGVYASISRKQKPSEACRYGLLAENNRARSLFRIYPPIVTFAICSYT